jgi:hypothetical protein
MPRLTASASRWAISLGIGIGLRLVSDLRGSSAHSIDGVPIDRPTAALAYRVKDLTTSKRSRRDFPVDQHVRRAPQQQGGPSLGM